MITCERTFCRTRNCCVFIHILADCKNNLGEYFSVQLIVGTLVARNTKILFSHNFVTNKNMKIVLAKMSCLTVFMPQLLLTKYLASYAMIAIAVRGGSVPMVSLSYRL